MTDLIAPRLSTTGSPVRWSAGTSDLIGWPLAGRPHAPVLLAALDPRGRGRTLHQLRRS
jgi:hypothetical protein